MAAVLTFAGNIGFTMYLYKDGTIVAESGSYDEDAIDSLTIFYKARVTGSSSNFRYCI